MKSEPTSVPPSSPNTANDSGARLVGAAEQDFNSQVGTILEFERPFRAVLVADVVSYTRLMEAAEVETHSRYRALRVSVIDPALIGRRGEIVKNTGDGFVAVFESPLDALRCASELQREVTGLETLQPPERRIAFRIGVHWEPVIFDLNDVYGHGVNIAARLQSVAPAGGVVVSSALLRVVADLSEFKFDDLGELHLKNLSRPVHAFLLLSPGVDRRTVIGASTKSSRRTKLPSIAVLPFANSSSEVDDSYFAEGFVEDIIVSLSNIQELLVVSRGSTMPFRQREIDPVEIGEKLGVRYYVSGHVRRSGKRFRFSVELVDVATGSVVWAEKYDTDLADVFEVQDEIAIGVVEKIAAYVRRAEIKRALRKPPKSLNAYDYLLRALELLYKFDFASFSRAKGLLEKASEEDPEYAAPYAFAAKWHNFKIAEGWSSDFDADSADVIRLSNCAIERDPQNALALAIQGHGKSMFFRDYDSGLDLCERALAISPSNSWAWVFGSGTPGFIGDASTGIARAERAIRHSPLGQQAFFNFCLLGQNHYLNGTFDDAIRWSKKSLTLSPRFGNAARVLAASLVAVGRLEEARQVSQHHKNILPGFRVSDYARRCPFKEPQGSLYVERLGAAGLPD
ncbi:adenylate/guanylate cyclase domain-containing protein [Bradyrhizobium sp. 482_C4_N1_1]|uniref:adenylate/guanylate cyclase domain-containing protein n=1 Tax=unclassified Bradyrhizobium TaxID=2631580 RepID=UPI003F8BBF2B